MRALAIPFRVRAFAALEVIARTAPIVGLSGLPRHLRLVTTAAEKRRDLSQASLVSEMFAAVATSREGHRSPRSGRMKFFGKTAGDLSGYPSSSPRAKNFWSLGSFFELDKKEIGHQSPQS